MKKHLIIKIDGGIVIGAYTNSSDSFRVEITDLEDDHDPDRKADRHRLSTAIKQPNYRNLLDSKNE